jgi:hypothetical protein
MKSSPNGSGGAGALEDTSTSKKGKADLVEERSKGLKGVGSGA